MISIRAAYLCCVVVGLVSTLKEKIPTNPGKDVKLPCKAANRSHFTVVKWTKSDLEEKYVFLQVDSHAELENQHPSFKNRVYLQDRQMKDGDVSLILKNVTINDTGTYECYVKTQNSWRKKANLEPISSIYLSVVDPPGQTGGHTEAGVKEDGSVGLIVALLVTAVLIFAVVGFLIYRYKPCLCAVLSYWKLLIPKDTNKPPKLSTRQHQEKNMLTETVALKR